MAIASLVLFPLGLLFILSGLVVNCIQAFFFITVRPFSRRLYRKINSVITQLLWLEIVWIFDWWANIKVEFYIDEEDFHLMGKEHALVISNHRSDIDWLVGWILAQRSGCLGSALALMKKSAKFLPVIGWSMLLSEYIFLDRNWTKDEKKLKLGFEQLRDFPQPFWLALLVEGTRFTEEKLLAAQEFAASNGLPVPRNLLIPRTKGFVSAVNNLRSFVPAIYNMTVAIPKSKSQPTMLSMLRGQSSVVHVHLKRHLMNELPETDDGIAQWCKDVFVVKDALLEVHNLKDTFGDTKIHDIGQSKTSFYVIIFWSCLLIFWIFKFFEWCQFSWKQSTYICFSFLAVVFILTHILIRFTQSEYSTPPSILKQKLLPR